MPDYQSAVWYGFALPAGTSPAVIGKLREATVAATQTADAKTGLTTD